MKRLCTALVCAMLLTLALTACDVVPATVFSEKNGNVSMNHLSAPKAGSPASDAPTVDEALPQDRASQTDGTASSQQPADISESAAKDIALTHAGVREADVTRLKVELDREKGQLVYEVEFRVGADKYEYDIHAESGTILKAEKNDRRLTAVAPTPTEPTTPPAPMETTPVTTPEAAPETIDEATAKDIALTHAGIREADVARLKVELDREKGQLVYEVEFRVGADKYEYDIHAESGTILKAEKNDRRLTAVAPTPTEPTTPSAPVETTPVTAPEAAPETIDEASAKDIALTHAGVREADAARLRVELDREKGQLVYEVEFKFGGYEYEYTVSAADGSILEAEKEWDD